MEGYTKEALEKAREESERVSLGLWVLACFAQTLMQEVLNKPLLRHDLDYCCQAAQMQALGLAKPRTDKEIDDELEVSLFPSFPKCYA